ncbi:SspB family protein [Bacillus subtilis]|uniref:SspB family protein n=1 Tax=Pseudochrobactrum asaccharolyticum TaxID=354351 RepID=UPI001F312353|nr:SspB family protein [Pseudochrobactrum asaccharolyticum]MCF7645938.1 SspB family protein [Pseudochrobactrum asaccharolyticum]MCF7672403.1 SspB family protein [Bacillus subtilis]
MVQDLIRYDILAQDALRGVIRKVLMEVNKAGLPGNHHFFITFLTEAPGVRISSRLKEKYPEQMTIVLQHQYWDLVVTEQLFEVGLSFGEIAEKLVIPFSAIRGFYDPSVNFELEFDVSVALPTGDNDTDNLEIVSELRPQDESITVDDTETAAKPVKKPAKKADRSKTAAKDDSTETAETEEDAAKPSADVVSLDAFRKK